MRVDLRRSTVVLPALLLCLGSAGCFNAPPPKGPPVDTELAEANNAASLAYARGQTAQALTLYQHALDRARAMDDAAQIGSSAYNLAAVMIQARKYAPASVLLGEAERETLRAKTNVADVLLLEAKLARLQGDAGYAKLYTDAVLNGAWPPPHPPTSETMHARQLPATPVPLNTQLGQRVLAHLIRGEVAIAEDNVQEAQSELTAAQRELPPSARPALRASVAGLTARVARESGRAPQVAASAFDRQVDLLREAHLYSEMASALADAGRAYASINSLIAADRFYRAGRSYFGQGNLEDAQKALAKAASSGAVANWDMMHSIELLQQRIARMKSGAVTGSEGAPATRAND